MKKNDIKQLNEIKLIIQNKILEIIASSDDDDQSSIDNIMETLKYELKDLGYNVSYIDTKSGYWLQKGDVSYLTDNIELIKVDNFNFQISFNQNKKMIDSDDHLYQYTILNHVLSEYEIKPIVEYTKEANGFLFSFLSNGHVNLSNNDGFDETFINFSYAIKHSLN